MVHDQMEALENQEDSQLYNIYEKLDIMFFRQSGGFVILLDFAFTPFHSSIKIVCF